MQINRQTYEEFFLLYADGELNESQRRDVEIFVDRNPDLEGEFNLIRETIMVPDESIVFDHKELLFNKEDNRKVVMMRWSRYAAAAVVLLGLCVAGWLFLDEQRSGTPAVAIVENRADEPALKQNDTNTGATSATQEKKSGVIADVPAKVSVEKPLAVSVKRPANQIAVDNKKQASENKTQSQPIEVVAAPIEEPTVAFVAPDPAEINHDVVTTEPSTDPIYVEVSPREMASQDEQADSDVHYTQAVNRDREKSDMIYFANTSLTKKTKLRGVFRKASRYLERVTSIQ